MWLEYKLLKTLKKGVKRLNDQDAVALRMYITTQMSADGSFVNRAGMSDLYYTLFGWIVCYVMGIDIDKKCRKSYLNTIDRNSLDSLHMSVYRQCVIIDEFLCRGMVCAGLRYLFRKDNISDFFSQYLKHAKGVTLNTEAVKLLTEEKQCLRNVRDDSSMTTNERIAFILSLQDETGGFRANEGAYIPDLLSTAVALFTLQMQDVHPRYDAKDFIEVHINDDGSFMDNLLDRQSDMEYVFYGLLAMGC